MSERKRTPLPLVMRRDKWFVVLRDSEGNPYVFVQDGDRPTFDHERIAEEILTSVNARPQIEELLKQTKDIVERFLVCMVFAGNTLEMANICLEPAEKAIREAEAALSPAADTNSPEVRRARGAM